MLDLRSVAARHEQFQEEVRRNQLLAQLEAPAGWPSLRLRPVIDNVRRGLARRFSRRTLWGATAGIVLGAASGRLPFAASAAKKKRKRNKKAKKLAFNAFDCVDVGKPCRGQDANCCSGICQGKKPKRGEKDKSRCVAHGVGTCRADQDVCDGSEESCGTGAVCFRTTGNAGFCGLPKGGKCVVCAKDTDCEADFGPGAACVVCNNICEDTGTACFRPLA